MLGSVGSGARAQIVAARFDATAIRASVPGARLSILDRLSVEGTPAVHRAVTLPKTSNAMISYVSDSIAVILRLSNDQPPIVDRSLQEQGVDSMMATELRNRIASDFKIDVPMARLLSGASIQTIAAHLLAQTAAGRGGADSVADDFEELVL